MCEEDGAQGEGKVCVILYRFHAKWMKILRDSSVEIATSTNLGYEKL